MCVGWFCCLSATRNILWCLVLITSFFKWIWCHYLYQMLWIMILNMPMPVSVSYSRYFFMPHTQWCGLTSFTLLYASRSQSHSVAALPCSLEITPWFWTAVLQHGFGPHLQTNRQKDRVANTHIQTHKEGLCLCRRLTGLGYQREMRLPRQTSSEEVTGCGWERDTEL